MAVYNHTDCYGVENYSFVFPFERLRTDNITPEEATVWMQNNWTYSIWLSLVYVLLLHVGQKVMQDRKPFHMRTALGIWNTTLAVFSATGALRMRPEMAWALGTHGWRYSICTASYAQGVSGFWTEQFAMSKVLELGDTAFLVLRKRPVIFLHWYHHVTVLIYTWHAYKDHTASGRWFICLNYTAHAFMYSYFALRAFAISLPKFVPMCVTSVQIVQMVAALVISVQVYLIKTAGGDCQQTFTNLYFSFAIYLSYFLLFCHFFYRAYLQKNSRHLADQKIKQKNKLKISNGHLYEQENSTFSNRKEAIKTE